MSKKGNSNELCGGCVYYPRNLPASAYSEADYHALLQKRCAYDYEPADRNCLLTRKTSCSIVDLNHR